MGVLASPSYSLTPSSVKTVSPNNYLTSAEFTWLQQYLPDTYEKEFERYGNRTISSFLRMVGAELPTNSDLIKWAEQGRLHTKFTGVVSTSYTGAETTQTLTFTANHNLRVGQTIFISDETAGSSFSNKAIVTTIPLATTVTVAYYEATQAAYAAASTMTVFVYGSEFNKGALGMSGALDAEDDIFSNKPIIIKDKYLVSGSDMAQIGWIEITTENGAGGYLWYLKSEHETRLRFEDYLEMAMVEGIPSAAGGGSATLSATGQLGNQGTDGLFYVVENRGNVFSGTPAALSDFDAIIQRLDKQGSIQENALFINRATSFAIDDILAAQNSYGAGGTSYGLFDNDEEMALNLGFTGFKRGYEFYKTDWKYLNDATLRGGLE